jgi:hypothetical protein
MRYEVSKPAEWKSKTARSLPRQEERSYSGQADGLADFLVQ